MSSVEELSGQERYSMVVSGLPFGVRTIVSHDGLRNQNDVERIPSRVRLSSLTLRCGGLRGVADLG